MLFEGRGVGVLWVGRPFKGSFSEKQLTLLKTFAEQAVIAIQNARQYEQARDVGGPGRQHPAAAISDKSEGK